MLEGLPVMLTHPYRLLRELRIFYQFCVLQLKALALANPKMVCTLVRMKRNNHRQEL